MLRGWTGADTVEVDDLQAVLDKAESLGGRTLTPITAMEPGAFAHLADPDGLVVGIVKITLEGQEASQGPSAGDGATVDWFEILGTDAEQTQRFHTELFGWKLNESGFPGYQLASTDAGEHAIGGGLGSGRDGTWVTVYAKVADLEEALARAEDLGAKQRLRAVQVLAGGLIRSGPQSVTPVNRRIRTQASSHSFANRAYVRSKKECGAPS